LTVRLHGFSLLLNIDPRTGSEVKGFFVAGAASSKAEAFIEACRPLPIQRRQARRNTSRAADWPASAFTHCCRERVCNVSPTPKACGAAAAVRSGRCPASGPGKQGAGSRPLGRKARNLATTAFPGTYSATTAQILAGECVGLIYRWKTVSPSPLPAERHNMCGAT
jgi:hypothetical protein